ncbi:hypothetical protein K443DRAFT_9624 [Laccaria amethystina LaAM-08-1]|uniref:Uncharacterized protein n=1 Tax=Laccaria amethystina LaAM-08-1 TaxID=1095629 RepID=A0A0C9WM47_9AGAR|nr:hypothetical protein K443DRAFT_9624 [Laccaria amethystina LaAM-08-1]
MADERRRAPVNGNRCHVANSNVATKRRATTKTCHSSSFCNLGHHGQRRGMTMTRQGHGNLTSSPSLICLTRNPGAMSPTATWQPNEGE